MRIRRNAARLLGSACLVPAAPAPDAAAQSELLTTPPPFYMEPCPAPESRTVGRFVSPANASGETCELNRSPWDLIGELSLSDPQEEDELVGKYFVSVTCRASWLFPASMPVASVKKKQDVGAGTVDGDSTTSQPRQKVQKKVPKKLAVSKEKETEPKKKAKVKKEEDQEVKQPSYKCKKNDGRRWHCHRPVSRPNSLCDYHSYQKRAYLNPEFAALVAAEAEGETEVEAEMEVPQPAPASKPPTSSNSKPRKKKPSHDFDAAEGFYYYAGFGPCRSKRHCRSSSSMNGYVPVKKEEEEPAEDGSPINEEAQAAADDTIQQAAGRDGGKSSCDAIAGVDEESSDDHYELGSPGRDINGSGKNRVGSFDGKMNKGWEKRRRKPVKARSLKSLM